jgi:hypothetical protein
MPGVAKKKPTPPDTQAPAEDAPKAPARPVANRTGEPLYVWIEVALGAALTAYLNDLRPRATKTAVVEMALEEFLRSKGYFPPPSSEEGR